MVHILQRWYIVEKAGERGLLQEIIVRHANCPITDAFIFPILNHLTYSHKQHDPTAQLQLDKQFLSSCYDGVTLY